MKMKKRTLWLTIIFCSVFGFVFPKINSAADNTYQQLKVLVDMIEIINKNYAEDIDYEKLIHGAARGMVDQLDEFSQFMDKNVYKIVMEDTEGEFGGIGIRLDIKDGWPTIITPMPGTPAYKMGLLPGDKIVKIESETTKNMVSDEVVKRLRGKPGTKVKITIAREPVNKDEDWIYKDLEISRELIKPETVKYKPMPDSIAYVRIVDFSGHMVDDFANVMKKVSADKSQGLILDLRYNPGGLLMGAVDLSRFFISGEKMIVYTKGKNSSNYQEFHSYAKAPYPSLPIVVLINKYSASASEIFAGAMQDNRRAVIIGETSFGKASVQQIIPLADGSALRLTIAHYYTPSGKMIHRDPKTGKGGITPDIKVKISREDELKVFESMEEIYYPQKENAIKDKPKVKDECLERALEILKARDSFLSLKQTV